MANPQYDSMLAVARQRIARHRPEDIARRAAVCWRDGCFLVPTLGKTVAVALPSLALSPEPDMWHALTLLHYLDLADGTPLTGRMMAFGQYRDGMVRGGDFDRRDCAAAALPWGRGWSPPTPISAPAFPSCPAIPYGCGCGWRTRSSPPRGGCSSTRPPPIT